MRQPEQKVSLILARVSDGAHLISVRACIEPQASIVSRRNLVRTHAIRHFQELIELHEVIAKRAGNGRTSCKVILHKGLDHLLFEPILKIDNVVRDAETSRYGARIVYIVERATTSHRAPWRCQSG